MVNQQQQQQTEFRVALDKMGTAAVFHPLIKRPLRIAHLTDLHVLPRQLDDYSNEFAQFVRWQSDELSDPNAGTAQACARIAAAAPDAVLVGGDVVDFLDDQAVDIATGMLEESISREARIYYCVGNHERPWSISFGSPAHIGGASTWRNLDLGSNGHPEQQTIPLSEQPFEQFASRFGLAMNPVTGRYDYSVVIDDQVRVVVLDTSYGDLLPQQAAWIDAEVRDGLPFLILTHVPFPVLTLVPRIRMLAGKMMLGHILDDDACHAVMSLTCRPNFLGALAGHIHARSEDMLGNTCQLLTQSAAFGGYRVIDLLPVSSPRIISPTSLRLARKVRRLESAIVRPAHDGQRATPAR